MTGGEEPGEREPEPPGADAPGEDTAERSGSVPAEPTSPAASAPAGPANPAASAPAGPASPAGSAPAEPTTPEAPTQPITFAWPEPPGPRNLTPPPDPATAAWPEGWSQPTTPPPPPTRPTLRRRAARAASRPWLLALIGFFLTAAAWSFASPMSTSPDEPSHMVWAAATARGEFTPSTTRHEITNGFEKTWLGYPLPAKYDTLDAMSACFRLKLVSAACGKKFGTDTTREIVETSAGNYNPAYYFPVGLPSLVLPGVGALYGMRLMSALLNSALLAAAVGVAAGWRRPGWPILGVLACGTPMTLFLSGTVNPNGMEATSAVLAWTAGMSLALDNEPRPGQVTRRAIALAVGGVLLANTRSLGVLFVLSVVAALAIVAGPRGLARLIRHRAVQIVTVVLVAGAVAAILWNRYSATLTTQIVSFPDLTPGHVATEVFWHSGSYITELIGNLGWLDTALPPGTAIGWYAVVGLLALTALGCARWRERLVVAALVVGTVLIPILAQASEAKQFGIGWQGRYILAWVVGLPVLAGLLVARRVGPELPGAVERRVPTVAAIILGLAGIGAFYWSMTRYAHGGWKKYGIYPIQWAPPGRWITWWIVYGVGLAVLVTMVAVRRREVLWRPPPPAA